MNSKRFRLEGVVYEIGSQSDVTLRDFILLEQETIELGKRFTMGDIVRLAELFQTLTPEESKVHEDGAWMLSATIWIAMIRKARQHGDSSRILFAHAIDADLSTFEQLEDPQDRAPGKPKGARKATGKKPAKKTGRPTPRTPRSSVPADVVAEPEPAPSTT